MSNELAFWDVEPEEVEPCIGHYYRGVVNRYFSLSHSIVKKELRLLKRKSCKNEECHCWTLDDDFMEIFEGSELEIEHGKLYRLEINGYQCRFTGEWDCDYGFVEVKDENK